MKLCAFRFLFIYFCLSVIPWAWLSVIPGLSFVLEEYYTAESVVVTVFNQQFLHVSDALNANGMGSGDTSYAWAQFYTTLILSLIGMTIWTIVDRKSISYPKMAYILETFVRYNVIVNAFSYGIAKILCIQMPFPSISQLATPLGDFLPMRLSWMFMGYSEVYQTFAGTSELVVALLLIFKPTRTIGALLGTGVFFNVFMMNLGYDIPVKLFSLQLTICCLYLVSLRSKQLYNFFILNKLTELAPHDHNLYNQRWKKISKLVLKFGFFILLLIYPAYQTVEEYTAKIVVKKQEIPVGVYAIKKFIRNQDTIRAQLQDSLAWKDVIFDNSEAGSINTCDTTFRHRYHRGYFIYELNAKKDSITFSKGGFEPRLLFTLHYSQLKPGHILLDGLIDEDTVQLELLRTDKHFQLTERQFHWISERNR